MTLQRRQAADPITTWRLALAAITVAAAVGWTALLGAGHLAGRATVLDRLEAPLLDMRFSLLGTEPPPGEVVIVAIDDATVSENGAYPLPRALLARLTEMIARAGPKAIGLDILFLDRGAGTSDAPLAATLRSHRTVIGAAALFPRSAGDAMRDRGHGDIPIASRILWPTEGLADAAGVGLVNIAADPGGTPRHVPLLVRTGSDLLPSFALALASQATGTEPVFSADRVRLGTVSSRLDLGRNLPLRFYGARGSIETIAAGRVLGGEEMDGHLASKVVIVGATAVGIGDTFPTPFDPVLPGVEVLATAVDHLLAGDGLVRDGAVRRLDVGAALCASVLAALALSLLPWGIGIGVTAAVIAGWLAITAVAFTHHVWLSAILPVAAMAPAIPIALIGRQIGDRLEQRRLAVAKRALAAYQPAALATLISDDPAFLAEPRTQATAIVFVDLSGFTSLSERIGSEGTRAFLKEFHEIIGDVMGRHGGMVMNFMGDGAMSVFGLPQPAPDDAARAVAAAEDAVLTVRTWLADRPVGPLVGIDLRAGVHCGEVTLSRLGAVDHRQVTVAGDTVNVASRLLEVAKQSGAALAVSEQAVEAARAAGYAAGEFETRQTVAIRGRQMPLTVAVRAL